MRVVIATGGFDPLHSGHINYLQSAKKLGDFLIVGLNSDEWLTRKKGQAFMPFDERKSVLEALECVDEVQSFDDSDNTAIELIERILEEEPEAKVLFANGGDRKEGHIPESKVANVRLYFHYGVGGDDKKNSSSWILQEWKAPKTERPWGYYRVLHEDVGVKVKELTINPGCAISMQKHSMRCEHWHIVSGVATVEWQDSPSWKIVVPKVLQKNDSIEIQKGTWHRVHNASTEPLKIVEIQYGEKCVESDIERDNNRFSNTTYSFVTSYKEVGDSQGC